MKIPLRSLKPFSPKPGLPEDARHLATGAERSKTVVPRSKSRDKEFGVSSAVWILRKKKKLQ